MTFHIGTPHTHNAGYFVNDRELKSRQEADVQTCPHCQAVIKMQEWRVAPTQNFCLKCMKPACNHPDCHECIPFIKKIEQHMTAMMRFERFSKMAGVRAPVTQSAPIYTGLT